VAVLIAGLTGTARIILKAHAPAEVYLGFLTGLVVVVLTLALF
jgi:membrane-associated phospholipid phosphatase